MSLCDSTLGQDTVFTKIYTHAETIRQLLDTKKNVSNPSYGIQSYDMGWGSNTTRNSAPYVPVWRPQANISHGAASRGTAKLHHLPELSDTSLNLVRNGSNMYILFELDTTNYISCSVWLVRQRNTRSGLHNHMQWDVI